MSFYSLSSPGIASTSSFHSASMSQTTSPAVPSIPLTESPVEVQWPVAPQPQPRPKRVAAQRTRQRKRVPHTLEITSKRNSSFSEYFKLDGALGVPVRGILDDTVVPDGHDERILERTGVRQIRLVVAVRLIFLRAS